MSSTVKSSIEAELKESVTGQRQIFVDKKGFSDILIIKLSVMQLSEVKSERF